ncbi:flavodoxin [Paucibacter sp. KBW04]|nr:flavodoxin [Paucibacter sp. KBW04]
MIKVAIVFHSPQGTTAQLAEAVAEGVSSTGLAAPTLIPLLGSDILEGRYRNEASLAAVDAAQAVIFGAPTFMGGPSAQFKAFADASSDRWDGQLWRNKLAAGFTIGSNLNGDQGNTLQYFAILAAQHGMLWAGVDLASGYDALGRNRLGVQLGASAQTESQHLQTADRSTAHYLGQRVANLANQMAR